MPLSRPVRVLAACAAFVAVGHVVGLVGNELWGVPREFGLMRQFDLNGEGNLAAWLSSIILLGSAAVAFGLTAVLRARRSALTRRWAVLTGVLVLMAADETAQLHDLATGPLRRGLDLDFGALYFAWLIPALALLGFGAYYFAPIFGSLTSPLRAQLLVAIAVYLGGAVGMEMVSGSVVADGRKALSYHTVLTVEELLELTGGLLLLSALLALVREVRPTLNLQWADARPRIEVGAAGVVPGEGAGSSTVHGAPRAHRYLRLHSRPTGH